MMRGLRSRGYFRLIRRKVTEFAGKVYVKRSVTPVTVDVTGATGVAVSVLTASGAAAGVVPRPRKRPSPRPGRPQYGRPGTGR